MGKNKTGLRKPRPGQKSIVFDEDARKSFLTGFRKRKQERRQVARQKLAIEVRNEKLSERAERREVQRKAVGLVDAAQAAAAPEDDDDDESENEEAECNSFVIGDTLTTTVVESLLEDPDGEDGNVNAIAEKPSSKKRRRLDPQEQAAHGSSVRTEGAAGGGRDDDFKARIKKKKFDLSQPLSSIIPGYKAPAGLKKRKKVKKRKVASKKDKVKQRAKNRQASS